MPSVFKTCRLHYPQCNSEITLSSSWHIQLLNDCSSVWGLVSLLKDTLTHSWGSRGFEPATLHSWAAPRWYVFEKDGICINIQRGIISQEHHTSRHAQQCEAVLWFFIFSNCCSSILLFDFHANLLNNVTQHSPSAFIRACSTTTTSAFIFLMHTEVEDATEVTHVRVSPSLISVDGCK